LNIKGANIKQGGVSVVFAYQKTSYSIRCWAIIGQGKSWITAEFTRPVLG